MIKNLCKNNYFFVNISKIYQSPNPLERIQEFSTINENELQQFSIESKIEYLPFLNFVPNKQLLQYIKQKNIAPNIRILHALTHIEYNAFMSYADTYIRFAKLIKNKRLEFQNDIKRIAMEQASHFQLLSSRLKDLGFQYGSLPVIETLNKAISKTQNSVLQRLAVISIENEGKGMNSIKKLITQLQKINDKESISVLKIIERDEPGHYWNGRKWFKIIAQSQMSSEQRQIEMINEKLKLSIQLL